MDIIASLASPTVASTPAGDLSMASSSEPFAQVLSQATQASEPVAAQIPLQTNVVSKVPAVDVAPPALTPAVTAPVPVVSTVLAAATLEAEPEPEQPVTPEPAVALATPQPVAQTKPAVTARPVTQPNPQAAAQEPEVDDSLAVDIDPVSNELAQDADPLASDSTDDSDSSLQDIRQRMDLIESAGQLDMASVIVVPPAPVQIMAVASGSGDVLGDTQQSPDDTASLVSTELSASASASASASDLASADSDVAADDQVSTLLDPANTVQTVAGSFSSQTRQSDSTLVDSEPASSVSTDPQGGFNLAALALNTSSLISSETSTSESPLLSATIGTGSWQDGLGQQVIDMFKRGDKQMDLRLHPADLGPLSISLNLSDGNTLAQFQSAHASVRAAVEQALPQLREALASQGITLGQASVGDESSRSSGQPQRDAPTQSNGSMITASETPLAAEEPVVQSLMVSNGGVDLYL
jgi:flagellar hook-length control protein FliK